MTHLSKAAFSRIIYRLGHKPLTNWNTEFAWQPESGTVREKILDMADLRNLLCELGNAVKASDEHLAERAFQMSARFIESESKWDGICGTCDGRGCPTCEPEPEPCRIAENLIIDYRDAIQKLPVNADTNSPEYLEAMNAQEAILTIVKMAFASAPRVDVEALRPIFESTRKNLDKTFPSGIYWSTDTQRAWRAFLDGAYAQIGR